MKREGGAHSLWCNPRTGQPIGEVLVEASCLARNFGFAAHEANRLESIVEDYSKKFIEEWYGHISRSG